MKINALTELMHTVLDGEATPDEARELDRRLAADPAARAEFEALRSLFDGLSHVPQVYPPEGLVASVMAGVSQPRIARDDLSQPFAPGRVIGSDLREDPDSDPGKSANAHFRSNEMSQEKGGSKRKIWIGGAIAAAAAVLAISSGIDFPPGGKDTAGTIVPAQRYRATQPGAEEVKLGGQSATTTATDSAGNQGNVGQAGPGQSGPGRAGPGQSGPGQSGPGQAGPGQAGPGQSGPGQSGPGQAGPGQAGPGQAGPGQAGPGQAGPGQAAAAQGSQRY